MEYKFDTKFKVGEILYTLVNNKIKEVKIEKIEANVIIREPVVLARIKYSTILNDYTYKYLGFVDENDLYRTKEELINNL